MSNEEAFAPVTIETCNQVLEIFPDLRANGFREGYPIPITDGDIRVQISKARRFLTDNCVSASAFGHGSYGLKHRAEMWVPPYVCNGALIAAAVLEGYAIKRDGINALVALRYVPRYTNLVFGRSPPSTPNKWSELEVWNLERARAKHCP